MDAEGVSAARAMIKMVQKPDGPKVRPQLPRRTEALSSEHSAVVTDSSRSAVDGINER
jgi:hypothetical protein